MLRVRRGGQQKAAHYRGGGGFTNLWWIPRRAGLKFGLLRYLQPNHTTIGLNPELLHAHACATTSPSQMQVAHFRWQLVYHGRPSSMGLRHFQKNGVFVSPHFGETRWHLGSEEVEPAHSKYRKQAEPKPSIP